MELQTLKNACRNIQYGYTASATEEVADAKFLRITDIQGGVVDWKKVPYCIIDEANKDKYLLDFGDIVVARTGNSTGENFIFESSHEAVFASYLIRFQINDDFDPKYIWYCMRSKFWRHFIESFKTGSAQMGANAKTLGEFKFPAHPLKTQKNISYFLSTFDKKIELNQKMKETLEEIAKALFKSWFVDFDPVKAKAEGRPTGLSKEISDLFPDSFEDFELGKIPQGWQFSSLHEVFDIEGGTQPPAKTFIDKEKEGYIRLLQIRDYNVDNHKTYVPLKKNLRIVDEDDVLIGRYGSGNGNFMEDSLGRPLRGLSGAINVAIVRTIPKLENSREYIANLVSSGLFYRWIVGGSSRAVQAGFKKDDLKLIKLPIPSSQVLSVFEEFGFLIWKKTKVLSQENKILAELRDTLIPKLISGEIKISDAESIVEKADI